MPLPFLVLSEVVIGTLRSGGLKFILTSAETGVWLLWQRLPNLQESLMWKYQQGGLFPMSRAPLAVPMTGVLGLSACLVSLRVRGGPAQEEKG